MMNFYTMAGAIGVALGIIWAVYLVMARAYLRRYHIRPNALFTVFTVGLVILLMIGGYRMSDYLLAVIGRANPKDIVTFRRIWLAIWAVSMLASIQIFIDIRRMAETRPSTSRNMPKRVTPPTQKAGASTKLTRTNRQLRNKRG
ncbi:MAG: hypothetical protein ACREQ4_09330 [Candidatus Binataceae bacterium]